MFDCSQLKGHLRDICEGTHKKANGRTHTLDERRAIVGRYLRIDASQAELPMPATASRIQSEIGTRLHAIIERDAGAKIECSECRDEVTRLNLLTVEQVQAERESIAAGIVDRAKKKAPKFYQRWGAKLAPGVAKLHALAWIDEACQVPVEREKQTYPLEFVTTLVAGMRVAKRATERWAQTIESITRSGFPIPLIFAEPDAGIDDVADHIWPDKLGAFKSFTAMCEIMVQRSEEWLLLCEDDVDFSSHTMAYVRTLSLTDEVVSLYTSGPLQNPSQGLSECGPSFIGSHAILMRRSVLAVLMQSPVWRNWPKHDCVDKLIRKVTLDCGIPFYTHNPSLCQHTGDAAAIYPNRKLSRNRLAKDWAVDGPWTPPLVTLITPTGDRQKAFALCERWMSQQDYTGQVQWIVIDDGTYPTQVTNGQQYIRESPLRHHSLCRNLRSAIPHIKGECVLIIEDDDYYHPHYVSTMVGRLQSADLVGEVGAKYYYIRESKFYHFINEHSHASLCRTGMNRNVLDTLQQCCEGRNPSVDLRLWKRWTGSKYTWKDTDQSQALCVGIKGMEGRVSKNWKVTRNALQDTNAETLRRWIGKDWTYYRQVKPAIQGNHDLTVMTCIFNKYDPLKNPIMPGAARYLCVTDQPCSDPTIHWECEILQTPAGLSRGKAARYYKINSHLAGIDSEWSFYIDGSMRLIVDPQQVIDDCLKLGEANLYLWEHHERSCIYQEAKAVGNGVKESRMNADAAAARYRQHGYPDDAGLYLGGIIVRRGDCREFNEIWWREVQDWSVRDQISLPFAIKSSGIKMLSHSPMTWTKYMIRHAHRSKTAMQRDVASAARFGVGKMTNAMSGVTSVANGE